MTSKIRPRREGHATMLKPLPSNPVSHPLRSSSILAGPRFFFSGNFAVAWACSLAQNSHRMADSMGHCKLPPVRIYTISAECISFQINFLPKMLQLWFHVLMILHDFTLCFRSFIAGGCRFSAILAWQLPHP